MVFLIMAFAEVSAILPNASATLITFFDRLNFEAAAPGLITEDFEAGKLPAGKNFTLFGSHLTARQTTGILVLT